MLHSMLACNATQLKNRFLAQFACQTAAAQFAGRKVCLQRSLLAAQQLSAQGAAQCSVSSCHDSLTGRVLLEH
jgi:hypothetical protein